MVIVRASSEHNRVISKLGIMMVLKHQEFCPMEPLRRVEQEACLLTEILNKESYSRAAAQALAHNLITHAHTLSVPNLKSVGGILGNRDRRPCSFVAALKRLSLPQGQSASSLACLLPHPRALVLGMCIAGYPKSTGQTGTSLSTLSSSVTSLLKLLHFQPHTCWYCFFFAATGSAHYIPSAMMCTARLSS